MSTIAWLNWDKKGDAENKFSLHIMDCLPNLLSYWDMSSDIFIVVFE